MLKRKEFKRKYLRQKFTHHYSTDLILDCGPVLIRGYTASEETKEEYLDSLRGEIKRLQQILKECLKEQKHQRHLYREVQEHLLKLQKEFEEAKIND